MICAICGGIISDESSAWHVGPGPMHSDIRECCAVLAARGGEQCCGSCELWEPGPSVDGQDHGKCSAPRPDGLAWSYVSIQMPIFGGRQCPAYRRREAAPEGAKGER